jgi:hypothetical protein
MALHVSCKYFVVAVISVLYCLFHKILHLFQRSRASMAAPVLNKPLLAVGQSQQVMSTDTTAFMESQQQYVAVPVPVQPVLAGTIITSLPPPSDVCHAFSCQECTIFRSKILELIWEFLKFLFHRFFDWLVLLSSYTVLFKHICSLPYHLYH